MKIKRYMADSMRAAPSLVRAEQGPDAVILSSRRVEEGIEVIAAVDYDESLLVESGRPRAAAKPPQKELYKPPQQALENAAPARPIVPMAAVAPAPAATSPRAATAAQKTLRTPAATAVSVAYPAQMAPSIPETAAVYAAPTVVTASVQVPPARAAAGARTVTTARVRSAEHTQDGPQMSDGYFAMQKEIKGLRDLLMGELKHLPWNDRRVREPLQVRVLEHLTAMDIAPDVALSLSKLTPKDTSLKDPSHIPMALLVRHMPVVEKLTSIAGGIVALVGPTGAGKTTTIAKLAARWSMEHGSQDLALVSTDGYRIGAREQLMTYARMLGAPMHVANDGQELARVLMRLKSKKMILIDTAGMGPRDVRLGEQLSALRLGAAGASVMLALPAQAESHALEEIVRAFARVAPASCILTKVDEAASLGGVLSTTLRHKLKIAYLCNGQRVPEDLHPAHAHRVWLATAALKLRERAAPRGDAYFDRNFGGAQAHA